ncbi:hypothetical protein CFOL_v3_19651 [Cephalotus follicularis]|uniref:Uncharacterized protein n=1 Tax=Cephalotus follicularis TaxID=3775 RepID=A0A1Q3C7A9_CEPFO|nr:hypothetical protein CFOL_v3_19651 [Cephalotus follicularis]
MSLVDYASSDDDVLEAEDQHKYKDKEEGQQPSLLHHNNLRLGLSPNQQEEIAAQSSLPSIEKLPDASLLLSSPILSLVSGGDHASRVAAAMAESASRKRESNGKAASSHRSKVPRGNLHQSRNIPDTVDGLLLPPQLGGRLLGSTRPRLSFVRVDHGACTFSDTSASFTFMHRVILWDIL